MMILAIAVLIGSTAAIATVIYATGVCLCQAATIFITTMNRSKKDDNRTDIRNDGAGQSRIEVHKLFG